LKKKVKFFEERIVSEIVCDPNFNVKKIIELMKNTDNEFDTQKLLISVKI